MCGIVGLSGNLYKKETDAFTDLLIFSQVRGPHSTGVGSVAKNGRNNGDNKVELAKCIGRPDSLIDWDKRYDKVVGYDKKFILGHNRYATTGKIVKKNAHPFEFNNILGCHNGTIPEMRLKRLTIQPDQYDTDSECVLANINTYPLKDVMKEMYGAWALVWYDKRDSSVNMLRNKERSLFYSYSADREVLYWASESGILKAALDRNGVLRDKLVYDVTEGMHLKWIIPDLSNSKNRQFDKPTQEKIPFHDWKSEWKDGVQGFFPNGAERIAGPVSNIVPFNGANTQKHNSGKNITVSRKVMGTVDEYEILDIDTNTWHKVPMKDLVNAGVGNGVSGQNEGTPCPVSVKDFKSVADLKGFDNQGYFTRSTGHKKGQFYRGFRGAMLNQAQFDDATKEGCVWCEATAVWGQPVRFIEPTRHICLQCNSDKSIQEMFPSQKQG